MTKSIQKLTQSKSVQKFDACSILSFEDPLVLYRTDYLVCTQQIDQGVDFRNAVYNAWQREMTLVSPADRDFIDYLPELTDDNEFNVKVILPATGD